MGTSPARTSSTTRCSSVKVLPVPADASSTACRSSGTRRSTAGRATRRGLTAPPGLGGQEDAEARARSSRAPRASSGRGYSCGRGTGPYAERSAGGPSPPRIRSRASSSTGTTGARRTARAMHEDRLAREEVRVRLAEQLAHAVAQPAPGLVLRQRRRASCGSTTGLSGRRHDEERPVRAVGAEARRREHRVVDEGAQHRALSPCLAPLVGRLVRALRERDRRRRAGPERQRAPVDLGAHDRAATPAASTTSTSSTSASCTRVGARVLARRARSGEARSRRTGRRCSSSASPRCASARRWSPRSPVREDARRPEAPQLAIAHRRVVRRLEPLGARGRAQQDLAQEQRLVAERRSRTARSRARGRRRPRPRRAPGGTAPTPGAGARGTSRSRASARRRARRSTARPAAAARGAGGAASAAHVGSRPAPRGRRRRARETRRAVSLEAPAQRERPRLGARLRERHRAERARLAAEEVREVARVPAAQRMPAPQRSPRRPRSRAAMRVEQLLHDRRRRERVARQRVARDVREDEAVARPEEQLEERVLVAIARRDVALRGAAAQRRSSGSSASGEGNRPSPIPHAKTTRNGSGRIAASVETTTPSPPRRAGGRGEPRARELARDAIADGASAEVDLADRLDAPQAARRAARPRSSLAGATYVSTSAAEERRPTRAVVIAASQREARVGDERTQEHAERRRVVQLGARDLVRHVRAVAHPERATRRRSRRPP